MEKYKHHDIIHSLFIIFIMIIIYSTKRYINIYIDFTDPLFVSLFVIFSIFSYWGLNHKRDAVRRATQRAMSGFIIAYLAHLDLVFVAYMVIWMFVYHTGDEWV